MVTAFVGVGVYTFYPHRLETFDDEIRVLRDQQQVVRDAKGVTGLTADQQTGLSELYERVREIEQRKRERMESWALVMSIILIVVATLVMGVSLIGAERIPVINNGLLLGGVFTMLYATGWILFSGTSRARFWVMGFALLITLLLGYARFVRVRKGKADETKERPAELGSLEARVDRLEHRVSAAAEAMKR
jgi:hypothetical protein